MACVDFLPATTKEAGAFSPPDYAPFSNALDSANQWLIQNPTSRVLNCETLTIKGTRTPWLEFSSERSLISDYYRMKDSTHASPDLMALRLWYLPDNQGPAQQLSYITLLPTLTPVTDHKFVKPDCEDLDNTIRRYNDQVKYSAPSGFILNVETVVQRCGFTGNFDGERTYYSHKPFVLNIVRVWLVIGSSTVVEEIGCTDFMPQTLANGGGDTMSVLSQRANTWLQEQAGIRFAGLEFNYFKDKVGVDSKRPISRYWVHTKLIQYCRIWYAKPLDNIQMPRAPLLTYITFEPAQIASGCIRLELQYETIHQLLSRIYPWIGQCGARLLAVQPIAIPCMFQMTDGNSVEDARHTLMHYSKLHIRLIFDGEYRAPWPGIILEPPPMQDHACCTLL